MNKALAFLLVLMLSISISGCGGCNSKNAAADTNLSDKNKHNSLTQSDTSNEITPEASAKSKNVEFIPMDKEFGEEEAKELDSLWGDI